MIQDDSINTNMEPEVFGRCYGLDLPYVCVKIRDISDSWGDSLKGEWMLPPKWIHF